MRRSSLWWLSVMICALSLIGFAGSWGWLFELASHFRVQYAGLLFAASIALLATKQYRRGLCMAAFVLVNVWEIAPLYMPVAEPLTASQSYRVMAVNVYAENRERDRLVRAIRQTNPDILILFEIDATWRNVTKQIANQFEFSHLAPRGGNFGVALFSRFPLKDVQLEFFGIDEIFAIIGEVDVDGHHFTVIGAHLLPPYNPKYSRIRNRHLADIAGIARSRNNPIVLIGDLNLSPWSPYFRQLIRDSELIDSRRGFGVIATWPTGLRWLGIPIDHCLVSHDVAVHHWTRGPDIGSDHFPITIDFSFDAENEGN